MKKLRIFAINFVVLAYSTGAVAASSTSQVIRRDAPKNMTATFFACIDKADSDTVALGGCLSAEKIKQDTRLNTSYKALLAKVTPKAKEELILAERDWLKFQETSGEFENSIYGDESVANLQLTQNEIFRICERANALDTYLGVVEL
jgi:uncharacterized protein YecT (DUF1311 family)